MRRETRFNECSPISVYINASVTNRSKWSNQIKQRSAVPLLPLFSPRFQLMSFGAAKLRSCCAVAFLAMSSPGPSVKKKRRQFSLKEKVDFLTELNAGKKQVDICRERDTAPPTVATILKDQEKIVKLHRESQLAPSRKRLRLDNYQTVDDAVLTWSCLGCCKDVPEDILRKVADVEAYMHQRLLSTRQKKITDFFKQ